MKITFQSTGASSGSEELIIYTAKLHDSDWLRGVQFYRNPVLVKKYSIGKAEKQKTF